METIRLRPHHVLDIVAYWKPDDEPEYERKPGENGVRTVCRMMTKGMDIVQIRSRYGPKLALMGGIDKHVLRRGRDEIVAELEYKIPPMVRTGGCVLALDHRVPNGTPLAGYRFYVQKAWEIMERVWATAGGA